MAVSLKQHTTINTLTNITLSSPLHLSLSKLDPTNPEHPMFNKANSLTLPILEIPITKLKDLLELPAPGQPPHQHYIIDGHTLHKKIKNIMPAHIQALNNLATLLSSSHHEPLYSQTPQQTQAKKEERLIHADNTHLLTTSPHLQPQKPPRHQMSSPDITPFTRTKDISLLLPPTTTPTGTTPTHPTTPTPK
jgi:hypothetical protein